MSRTLVLLRHAKSDYPAGVADHERPLSERGRHDARLAGDWLAEHTKIDLVLCSTATRTRETLERASEAFGGTIAPVEFLDDLYGESHWTYLKTIQEYGGDAESLLVIGHEPSVSATALSLTRDRTSKAARGIEAKYPTAGIAEMSIKGTWADLETGHADLVKFHVPR